jgi:hypothetical protein
MKHANINAMTIAAALSANAIRAGKVVTNPRDSYSGPGRIECFEGSCDFSVDPSLGCIDPCHTYTYNNPFEYSFSDVAMVSGKIQHYPTHELCYYSKANYIDTDSWWDPWGIKIDADCSAKCTGCDFYPTKAFTGPGSLVCTQGDCYNYDDGAPYNDCGTEIQDASEEWGEFALLGQGSNDAQVFEGYNNITTSGAVMIGKSCSLDCSSCQFVKDRRNDRLGAKRANTWHYSNDG